MYLIAAKGPREQNVAETLQKLGGCVVRVSDGELFEIPPNDDFDIVAVFLTDTGEFGGKHTHSFESVFDGSGRGFIVPLTLLHYIAGTPVSFLAIKNGSVGTVRCTEALWNFHHRDMNGTWHGPKKKRIRPAKPDSEPVKSHGVYALP